MLLLMPYQPTPVSTIPQPSVENADKPHDELVFKKLYCVFLNSFKIDSLWGNRALKFDGHMLLILQQVPNILQHSLKMATNSMMI